MTALARTLPATKQRTTSLQRERHAPDYVILVAVVALVAIGVLMVYSSSAMSSYLSDDDTFKVVGPQVVWAALGLIAMGVVSRIDYRYWRIASIPLYVIALGLLAVVVFVPSLNYVVGGSARFLRIGPLPLFHPAEFAKLALVVYLAHWFARRGASVRQFWRGTVVFLVISMPVVALVLREPDLGTSAVLGLTAFTMFFVAGANLFHLFALGSAALGGVAVVIASHPYQLTRIKAFIDPWSDPAGAGFHTIQGLMALALGGIFGAGLGESRLAGGLFLPNAYNDFIFAIIGEEFGLVGGALVVILFVILAYQGIRTALAAPDTFGALLAAGITAWICIQAFINIGVVVALVPVTGITLPFVSAGGSSLAITLTAVGILLAVSRETVEKGTWNDASADRRRGHGRAHLPGSRRRPVAARSGRG
ncbi:MAG TPA: putative lipid II flippase FtsW [Candidatus Binatia bacterium]|nr:putative lipid II flippase FtsW [Candidatus Binatia bacterium]